MRLILFEQARLERLDGSVVQFRSRNELQLLAMLAEQPGKEIHREVLIEQLWPSAFGESGRASLRNALSGVRKAIGIDGLFAVGDSVGLREDALADSDFDWDLSGDYRGDFMPGYSSDWVLDHRLRFREKWVSRQVLEARKLSESGYPVDAIHVCERGVKVDPLHTDCSFLLAQLLEELGHSHASVKVIDRHRGKVLQSLGLDSGSGVDLQRRENSLIEMSEWLFVRNPVDALEYLVSTGQYWASGDIEYGMRFHRRVLDVINSDSPARLEVLANYLQLQWACGFLSDQYLAAEERMREAFRQLQFNLGYKFGAVGMYGRLSAGDFKGAIRLAGEVQDGVALSDDALLKGRMEINVGIIYQHSGRLGLAKQLTEKGSDSLMEYGGAEDVAGACLVLSHYYAVDGRLNRASELLARARRYFAASGAERGESWVDYGEAELFVGIGELGRALELVNRINSRRVEVLGHSLVAAARDLSGRIHYELGEFDEAAFNLMGSRIWRNDLGVKASVYERKELAPAWIAVRERLSRSDLLRAYERARNPQPSSPN
ncbi:MAG: hypothetical protein ACKVQS_07610 [Fimbriimonadaceae bacterium]